MLRTPVCEILGIEVPIVQAAIAPFTSAELVAAVCNAGGLGSIGTALRSVDEVRDDILRVRELTHGAFAVNFTLATFDPETFTAILGDRPSAVSLALGDPGDLVQRAHDAGCKVIHQVHTVAQARQAAERGVDVIIAQGGEAGGFGGTVAALPLIPQVVDAVRPIPVLAAGGIADGRGLAAALVLGAQGVNIGTRFLASTEAPIPAAWKEQLVSARSEDAIKVEVVNDISPTRPPYDVSPRSLRSPFIDRWEPHRDEARRQAGRLFPELQQAAKEGRLHEYLPLAGQTAGLIREVLPAGEIVRRMVAEAAVALKHGALLLRT
jgi:nitronate monooxygenase/enoyl-[acyl-carrier protein] reductase II